MVCWFAVCREWKMCQRRVRLWRLSVASAGCLQHDPRPLQNGKRVNCHDHTTYMNAAAGRKMRSYRSVCCKPALNFRVEKTAERIVPSTAFSTSNLTRIAQSRYDTHAGDEALLCGRYPQVAADHCMNGGTSATNGSCRCSSIFEGDFCQYRE